MEMKVLEEKENKLLDRKEIKIELVHEKMATPKKSDFIKELAAKYSVPEEKIVIDYIFTHKGEARSVAKAKIYKEKPKIKVKKKEKKKENAGEAQKAQTV